MNGVIRIRDKKTGEWKDITVIKGTDGKSAYQQAVDGGFEGTEEEFTALLNGLAGTLDGKHVSNFNNPHKTTAEQTGAVPITGGIVQGNLAINKSGAPGLEFDTGKGFAILIKNAQNDVANPENNYDYGVLISDYAEETPGAGSLNLMLSYSAVEQNQFSMKSGLRLASIINGEVKYYNIYGEHNKPTPADIGALSSTGGVVSGNIDLVKDFMPCLAIRTNKACTQILRNASDDVEDGLMIRDVSDASDNTSYLSLNLRHVYMKTQPDRILTLLSSEGGVGTEYKIFGDHNKPTQSYQGDGETATRTINVGGIGNMLLVVSDNGMALVTSAGAIWKPINSSSINGVGKNECNYSGGVLTLNTNVSALNLFGSTYTCQVL